jgi:hypothetical protein
VAFAAGWSGDASATGATVSGDWGVVGEVGEVRARLTARGEGAEFMARWARVSSSSWMRQGGARPLCCATLRRWVWAPRTRYRVCSHKWALLHKTYLCGFGVCQMRGFVTERQVRSCNECILVEEDEIKSRMSNNPRCSIIRYSRALTQ